MIRAVLDANVLISGAITINRSTGTMSQLISALQRGEFKLILSHAILDEVRRNLPDIVLKMNLESVLIERFLAYLQINADFVLLTKVETGVASPP